MQRIIVMLSIITMVRCCQCHWNNRAPIDNYFANVANKVIEADRHVKTHFAARRSDTKEIYGENAYKYIVKIPDGTGSEFKLKTKNRALLIQGNGSCRSLSQIKILPDLLNYQSASWQVLNNELIVTMSYAGDNGDLKICAVPDPTERIVPNICKTDSIF